MGCDPVGENGQSQIREGNMRQKTGDPVKFVDRVVRSCGISFSFLCEGRDMVIF